MAKARRDLPPAPLYERDYYSWVLEQAALLRERRLAELDFDNLAEEVEDLGRSMADQLGSRYETLLMHLLKWEFQPDKRSNSWAGRIIPTALIGDRFRPLAAGDRGQAVGRRHEPVPRLAAGRDDGLVVRPDPQAEFVLPQVLPHVLDRVQLGAVARQG